MSKLQDFLNSRIADVAPLRGRVKSGELFGLEVECEGKNVDWNGGDDNLLTDWAPHDDGSLRKNHGSSCEWVFNGPVKHKKAVERVHTLFNYFDKRKARLVCSNRTSIHVHYNMGDKNVYQLVNMFILFTILEGLLDRYCGEDRVGNLFSLSSRHAEEQINWVHDFCFKHHRIGYNENWRYCSLNLAAINKFGTVEFRAMRGLDNREDIIEWLNIINEFCDHSCYKMKNPMNLIEEVSVKTPTVFVREIFSKVNADKLLQGLTEHEVNASVYEGLRLVQMLCYKIGTEFDQVKLKGKDFWASFKKEDDEIDFDINPNDIQDRIGRQRANPFLRGMPEQQPEPVLRGGGLQGIDPAQWREIQARVQAAQERIVRQNEQGVRLDQLFVDPLVVVPMKPLVVNEIQALAQKPREAVAGWNDPVPAEEIPDDQMEF